MLDVKQLFAGYGRLTALKGVDLSVKPGEVVFVVGPNGAGKSTLLKTIAGLMAPTSGKITFQGGPIHGRAPEQLCRAGLALIPEGRHIFKTLTVEENLAVGAMIRRKSSDRDIDLAVTYLERVAKLHRQRGDTRGALRLYRKIATIAPYRDDILATLMRANATGQFED